MTRPERAARSRTVAVAAAPLAVLLALLLGAAEAAAFGTINHFGQHAEHERITRAALACPVNEHSDGNCFEPKTMDLLAGKRGTFGGVGSPDLDEITNPNAHCDDADYLDQPGYPRTREQATQQLEACLNHLRGRFLFARLGGEQTITGGSPPVVDPPKVDISKGCPFNGEPTDRGKCDFLDQFGRALHGAQDFHSHSNWNDRADDSKPISITNPPGLYKAGAAPLVNLRTPETGPIPKDLATGCFSLNPFGCRHRITHGTLNKDTGEIDPVSGITTDPTTSRGKLYGGENFNRAVRGAMDETHRQWEDMRTQIIATNSPQEASLIICALTRDDPVSDCQRRQLAIVVDGSGSNLETDPSGMRIGAAMSFNASLISEAEAQRKGAQPDRSAVITFSSGATLLSPLADPSAASFAGIGASGGTCIACGINTARSVLAAGRAGEKPPYDRDGIVVLTDGQDEDVDAIIREIQAAAAEGIRTSIGFLSPPPTPVPPAGASFLPASEPPTRAALQGTPFEPNPRLVSAVQAAGGVVATISSAQAQRGFVNVAIGNGLTAIDDPNGSDDGGVLAPGIEVRGRIDPGRDKDTWFYSLPAKKRIRVTLSGPRKQLIVRLSKSGKVVKRLRTKGARKPASFTISDKRRRKLELVVSGSGGKSSSSYRIGVAKVRKGGSGR